MLIENRDATKIIKKYDSPSTLFYIDPPYIHKERKNVSSGKYHFEMNEDEHAELLRLLCGVAGMVVLSGYDCELYADLLPDWQIVKKTTTDMTNRKRIETLWISPNAIQ